MRELIAAFLLNTLWVHSSLAAPAPSTYDGNTLVEWFQARDKIFALTAKNPDHANAGRLHGIVEGVAFSIGWWSSASPLCIPDGTTMRQKLKVVKEYTNSMPSRWRDPAALLVGEALIEAWPCN